MGLALADLSFERPADLVAHEPAEERGLARDEVGLLVSDGAGHTHTTFEHLASFLAPGDLLVVNQSATLPAALDATGSSGPFLLDLCTDYGDGCWLAEPRWRTNEPGPLPLAVGDRIEAGGLTGQVLGVFPAIERLVFVRFDGDVRAALDAHGRPIRYGYVEREFPLDAYQTHFAAEPGSAEMPSAGRPFTERVVERLRARGVGIAPVTLHTGVSSLEVEYDQCERHCSGIACNPLYPEAFRVPPATAAAVERTRRLGGRVVAVGTTVVRALETAWDPSLRRVRATGGFTRLFVTPASGVSVVDGLLTGLHDPQTTHLAMLYAIAGRPVVMEGYEAAIDAGYLWHEFGDTHLLLPR
jgi:S-adenosylmethionine:tRNA ribosyltransferase-isomerase